VFLLTIAAALKIFLAPTVFLPGGGEGSRAPECTKVLRGRGTISTLRLDKNEF
jgi:hypothetical protein